MQEQHKTYISVILPLKLEWTPCYGVPEGETISQGDWVRVNFAGKEYLGTVRETGIAPETDPDKIKDISAAERRLGPVSAEERRLWGMVAEYYMCTIGEVFKAAYPAMQVSKAEALAKMQERELLRKQKAEDNLRLKIQRAEERLDKKKQKLSGAGNPRSGNSKAYMSLEAGIASLEEECRLLRAKLGQAMSGSRTGRHDFHPGEISLTAPQQKVYNGAMEGFRDRKPVLIKGITGSGKTEIYLKAALETLSRGKNVLYLVPEIALSRQLEYRLEKIFGTRLMAFHSGESIAQRRETASAVRQGQGTVLLGTRSALFLPHHDLGLIIVDEEHDSSYKQDSPAPRYNGRDTAVMLAGIHGCSILLGSATPSLESMHNCDTGKYALVTLDVRYHASEDADIEIIDTIAERKKRGMKGSFSIKLIEHINETLSKGRQVMLFRARRSFSPAMQCTSCGHIPKCPHCNASLSWHKSRRSGQEASGTAENAEMMYDGAAAGGRLVCHLCGYSRPFSEKCPECGGELRGLGAGTQKVEEEAAALFPGARIARLDSDTARSASYGKETIRAFARGEIDILIGTQMVTKGFDFPNLSLVAVLQADTLMSVQDFRADEKAAQLLEQFMGRCGRRGAKGLFVVQTSMPDHPVYSIIRGRMTGSEGSLLNERKEFGFPPYTRLVNIVIRDTDEMRAARMGTKLAGLLESGTPPYTVTGPYIPAVDKVADNHIRIIRLGLRKDRQLAAVKRHLMKMLSEFMQKEKYETNIVIDVDPS